MVGWGGGCFCGLYCPSVFVFLACGGGGGELLRAIYTVSFIHSYITECMSDSVGQERIVPLSSANDFMQMRSCQRMPPQGGVA